MMRRFEESVAIVTGGAQGIGAATIRSFSKEGANVIILDQDIKKMKEVMHEIHSNGGKGQAFQCNITNKSEVENSMRQVIEIFGKIDILVNNAGVTKDNLLFRMDEEEWDTVIDTHLKGSFICSQEAQKYMVEQGCGKIVMLSSRSALGKRGQINYATAKAGI